MLKRATLFGFCLAAVLSGACGELAEPCNNPTGQIGSCCVKDSDCSPYQCIEELPRGYCSLPCASDTPCPEASQSQCVSVNYVGQSSMYEKICLQECGGGLPNCRDDHACKDYHEASEGQVIDEADLDAPPAGTVCFVR